MSRSVVWDDYLKTLGLSIFIYLLMVGCLIQASDIRVGVGDQNQKALSIDQGRLVGSLASLYQCPMEKSGLAFDLRPLPQARVLLELERGEIQLALPLVRLDHRDKYAIFTSKLMDIAFVLYTTRDIDLSGELSAYNFTVLRASASIDLVAQRKGRFTEVTSWIQALELARLDRFDGAVIPKVVLKGLAAENFVGLRQLNFGSIPLSMYVSKAADNAAELVQQLNAAIDQCAGG